MADHVSNAFDTEKRKLVFTAVFFFLFIFLLDNKKAFDKK